MYHSLGGTWANHNLEMLGVILNSAKSLNLKVSQSLPNLKKITWFNIDTLRHATSILLFDRKRFWGW